MQENAVLLVLVMLARSQLSGILLLMNEYISAETTGEEAAVHIASLKDLIEHGDNSEAGHLHEQLNIAGFGALTLEAYGYSSAERPPVERATLMDTLGLTSAQLGVLELSAEGLTGSEIAETLFVSEKTIKNHKHRIYAATGARTLVEAVIIGFQAGMSIPKKNIGHRRHQ